MKIPIMTPRIKAWINALLSAFISGGLGSTAFAGLDHDHFAVLTLNFWRVFCAFGIIGILNHLRNSPLPNFFSINFGDMPPKPEPVEVTVTEDEEEGDLHQ